MFAAVVALMGVLCTSVVVLRLDTHQRRVDHNLEISAATSLGQATDENRHRRLRLQSTRMSGRRTILKLLFNYEPGAPLAWPAWRVALLASIAAAGAMMISRIALPLWVVPIDGVLAGMFVTRCLFRWQRDRYSDRLLRQLPDTIELIVSAVRAGLPPAEAFSAVAREMPDPTREQFVRVMNELAMGRAPQEALLSLFQRTQVSEYAMFAVTLAVQSRAGGRLAETLQILGETVRQRVALAGRAKALAGEAKLSAQVLASLPFVASGLMLLENHHAMDPLFDDPRGRMLFLAGVISLLLGIVTMRRMIKKGTTV